MYRAMALAFVLLFPQSGLAADAGVYIAQAAIDPTIGPKDHAPGVIFTATAADGPGQRATRDQAGNAVRWSHDGQAQLQVVQQGYDNEVIASQRGTGQRISVWQSGNDNRVVVDQSGAGNTAIIVQR